MVLKRAEVWRGGIQDGPQHTGYLIVRMETTGPGWEPQTTKPKDLGERSPQSAE